MSSDWTPSAPRKLRGELRKKNIKLEVVKNSLALRATEGTPLAQAFEGVEGTMAIVWGSDDFVSLTKEIVSLTEAKEFEGFKAKGGAMDGAKLSPAEIKSISKWPSRPEQLSILVGQILGPGLEVGCAIERRRRGFGQSGQNPCREFGKVRRWRCACGRRRRSTLPPKPLRHNVNDSPDLAPGQ